MRGTLDMQLLQSARINSFGIYTLNSSVNVLAVLPPSAHQRRGPAHLVVGPQ